MLTMTMMKIRSWLRWFNEAILKSWGLIDASVGGFCREAEEIEREAQLLGRSLYKVSDEAQKS